MVVGPQRSDAAVHADLVPDRPVDDGHVGQIEDMLLRRPVSPLEARAATTWKVLRRGARHHGVDSDLLDVEMPVLHPDRRPELADHLVRRVARSRPASSSTCSSVGSMTGRKSVSSGARGRARASPPRSTPRRGAGCPGSQSSPRSSEDARNVSWSNTSCMNGRPCTGSLPSTYSRSTGGGVFISGVGHERLPRARHPARTGTVLRTRGANTFRVDTDGRDPVVRLHVDDVAGDLRRAAGSGADADDGRVAVGLDALAELGIGRVLVAPA